MFVILLNKITLTIADYILDKGNLFFSQQRNLTMYLFLIVEFHENQLLFMSENVNLDLSIRRIIIL